jgi:hypothetical protein
MVIDEELLDLNVRDLGLRPAVAEAMDNLGVFNVRGVLQKRPEELVSVSRIGSRGLSELKLQLARHGITVPGVHVDKGEIERNLNRVLNRDNLEDARLIPFAVERRK